MAICQNELEKEVSPVFIHFLPQKTFITGKQVCMGHIQETTGDIVAKNTMLMMLL